MKFVNELKSTCISVSYLCVCVCACACVCACVCVCLNLLLFIELTSRLEVAVAQDLITSRVTWLEIIRQCKQEMEQDQHRDVTCSIELLSSAVSDVFRQRQTIYNNNNNNNNNDDEHRYDDSDTNT